MRRINSVYLHVLRMIIGDCRYGRCEYSDATVREILRQPSLDCLLLRRRLFFLGRIVATSHKSVLAVLSIRVKGTALPWVQQIMLDMETLYRSWGEHDKKLPPPGVAQIAWWRFMYHSPSQWKAWVSDIFFSNSILDKTVAGPALSAMFACHLCVGVNFATNQALLQHLRTKHKLKQQIATFVDGSGVCPACKSKLHTRLRVLKHLSDKRRRSCANQILSGDFAPVDADTLAKLEDDDRQAIRAARHDGHTSVPAVGQAVRSDGRRVGRSLL